MPKKLFLLDNTFFSDYESEVAAQHTGPARALARRLESESSQTLVSVVTIAEYYERFGRAKATRLSVDYTTLGLHVADAFKCGEIQARLAAKRLGENDAWLAAQAMRAGARLVTRDRRFRDVRGLEVEFYG